MRSTQKHDDAVLTIRHVRHSSQNGDALLYEPSEVRPDVRVGADASRARHGHCNQSDAGSAGIFLQWTNQTQEAQMQEAQVYSHNRIRRRRE
eukprot:1192823-Prorocentrum_minimum.AAC.1